MTVSSKNKKIHEAISGASQVISNGSSHYSQEVRFISDFAALPEIQIFLDFA